MKLIVYRLRRNGLRIHQSDADLRTGVRGDLVLQPAMTKSQRLQARLVGPDGQDLIQRLEYAEVSQIHGEAMHVTGYEYVARVSRATPSKWRQSWLCVWDEGLAMKIIGRIRVPAYHGFSPEDDDAPEWPHPPILEN